MSNTFFDVTAAQTDSIADGDWINIIRGQVLLRVDATTHLVSIDERAALDRPDGGPAFSATNFIVDASMLESEVSRASGAEAGLHDWLEELQSDLAAEASRATGAEAELGADISALTLYLDLETTARTAADVALSEALAGLDADLEGEYAGRTAADAALGEAIAIVSAGLATHRSNGDPELFHLTSDIRDALTSFEADGYQPANATNYFATAEMLAERDESLRLLEPLQWDATSGTDPREVYGEDGPANTWAGRIGVNLTQGEFWACFADGEAAGAWKQLARQDSLDSEVSRASGAEADIAEAMDDLTAALVSETAARNAGDAARLRGRRYSGGRSTLVAAAERAGICRNGASVLLTALAEGAAVVADLGNMSVALTDVSGPLARVQVSVVLASGTLVVRTEARVWALNIWQRLTVVVDAPVADSIGAASVHVYIDGVSATLETVADYSGAPVSTASAWSLGGDNAGANLLAGRVSQWGVLNYPLSPAQVADYIATARLPYEGAGAMQLLTNGSFETFTGTADDSTADTFAGWTLGTLGDGVVQAVSGGADGGYCMQISTGADLYRWATQNLPPLPSAGTVTISAAISGDGTSSGSWGIYNVATSAFVLDTSGVGNATVLATSGWTTLTRTWTLPANGSYRLHLYGTQTAGGIVRWDAVQARLLGNTLAGMDLAAQPVCSRATLGAVLLDSASGAEVWPTVRPERMTLASQISMIADGYLLADQVVHPAGYVVSSVLVTNSGSASATVTVRATSSSGVTLASGTVTANGAPQSLTVASGGFSALFTAGGKIHVAGGTASSPLNVTAILQRA
jgi:hypothetical protein